MYPFIAMIRRRAGDAARCSHSQHDSKVKIQSDGSSHSIHSRASVVYSPGVVAQWIASSMMAMISAISALGAKVLCSANQLSFMRKWVWSIMPPAAAGPPSPCFHWRYKTLAIGDSTPGNDEPTCNHDRGSDRAGSARLWNVPPLEVHHPSMPAQSNDSMIDGSRSGKNRDNRRLP